MTNLKKVKSEKGVVAVSPRRQYDEGFKTEAIRLVDSGRSVRDVATGLGISEQLLHNWRSRRKAGLDADSRALFSEVETLKKQLRQAEQERDILKKALAFFSRTTA